MNMTEEIHAYLSDLRDSGEVNMFGAAPYLIRDFGMGRVEAREALLDWMQKPEELT